MGGWEARRERNSGQLPLAQQKTEGQARARTWRGGSRGVGQAEARQGRGLPFPPPRVQLRGLRATPTPLPARPGRQPRGGKSLDRWAGKEPPPPQEQQPQPPPPGARSALFPAPAQHTPGATAAAAAATSPHGLNEGCLHPLSMPHQRAGELRHEPRADNGEPGALARAGRP